MSETIRSFKDESLSHLSTEDESGDTGGRRTGTKGSSSNGPSAISLFAIILSLVLGVWIVGIDNLFRLFIFLIIAFVIIFSVPLSKRIVTSSGNERNEDDIKEINVFGQVKIVLPLLAEKMGINAAVFYVLLLFVMLVPMMIGLFTNVNGAIIAYLILIAGSVYLIFGFLETIPSKHVGVPLVYGERISDYVLREGKVIVIPGWFDHEVVNIEIINIDFGIPLRDINNLQMNLTTSISAQPDINRLITYVNMQGARGVDNTEAEGKHGVVDKLIDIAKPPMTQAAKKLEYDPILALDASLGDEAIRRLVEKDGQDINNIRPEEPFLLKWLGLKIYNFVPTKAEPVGRLKELLDERPAETLQRDIQQFDAETQGIVLNTIMGRDVKTPISEDEGRTYYPILKVIEYGKNNPNLGMQIFFASLASRFDEKLISKIADIVLKKGK